MAKLYFRYGAMGSSKTANALMVNFNYHERGLKPLLLKPAMENRDGEKIIKSRVGLQAECQFVEDFFFEDYEKTAALIREYDAVIIDEVQFCEIWQIKMMQQLVTEVCVPIICYGLREDFMQEPFAASKELASRANVIEELKTVCWCGDGATCNTRLDGEGNVVRAGEQIMLGGNELYTSLCRKHYLQGDIGPKMRAKYGK